MASAGQVRARGALHLRWWPWHLLMVVVLVSFGWLGWWQLQSFESTATPSARPSSAPVDIDRLTRPGGRLSPDDLARRVTAQGTWEARSQLVVPGRERGGRSGSLVVTPLRTASGVLPVVRGWVPDGAPAPAPPAGTVTVTGVVAPSESEADAAVGAGAVGEGEVAYVATVALLERLTYDAGELYDGYVVLRSARPADPAAPALVEPDLDPASSGGGAVGRWRSLAYALQWWLFAGAAVVFWYAVLRRAARERAPEPVPADPDAGRAPLAAPRRTT